MELFRLSVDQVAFYYPKDFEIDTTHEDKNKICFMGEDEILSFFTGSKSNGK